MAGKSQTKSMRIIKISREEPFAKKLKDALAPVIPAYAEIQKNKLDPRVKPEDDTIVRLSFEENNLTVAEYENSKRITWYHPCSDARNNRRTPGDQTGRRNRKN